jgi:uncharacterized protein (DUF58 family)
VKVHKLPAISAAAVLGVVLVALGLLAGKPPLVVLGSPLLLSIVWRLRSEPLAAADASVAADPLAVELTSPEPAVARLRITAEGHRQANLVLRVPASVPFRLATVRTGPQPPVRVDFDVFNTDFSAQTPSGIRLSAPRVVLPSYSSLGPVPESLKLRGLTGPVNSPRPGDGLEFRDVRLMQQGDSWRRIDWRATARYPGNDPWIRGTFATGETVAVLILDSRDEVGPDLHAWRGWTPLRVDEPSSLDLARHAAASVAGSLLKSGARVGLVDLASGRRLVSPASGSRQLRRITYSLALSSPIGERAPRVRSPQLPNDAIIYLFSTLLDDDSTLLARDLQKTGHQVLVIDTLPQVRVVPEVPLEIAWRILRMERQDRITALQAEHIPVLSWAGDASRQQAGERLAELRRANRRRR